MQRYGLALSRVNDECWILNWLKEESDDMGKQVVKQI